MNTSSITLNGIEVRTKTTDFGEFLCITDLAKVIGDKTGKVIGNWIRLISTIEYLKEWEMRYNSDGFNVLGYEDIRMKAGTVQFSLSVSKWIKTTDAIGIITEAGKYGGTYAHNAIAMEFCATISPAFKLGVYVDYLELKEQQAQQWLQTYQFYINKMEENALDSNRMIQDMKSKFKKLD